MTKSSVYQRQPQPQLTGVPVFLETGRNAEKLNASATILYLTSSKMTPSSCF